MSHKQLLLLLLLLLTRTVRVNFVPPGPYGPAAVLDPEECLVSAHRYAFQQTPVLGCSNSNFNHHQQQQQQE